jgi:hypothetical protein
MDGTGAEIDIDGFSEIGEFRQDLFPLYIENVQAILPEPSTTSAYSASYLE